MDKIWVDRCCRCAETPCGKNLDDEFAAFGKHHCYDIAAGNTVICELVCDSDDPLVQLLERQRCALIANTGRRAELARQVPGQILHGVLRRSGYSLTFEITQNRP